MDSKQIAIFEGKKIRKTIYNNEWWFSVIDVIEALINSDRPSVYWTAMKARVKDESEFQLSTICRQLKLLAEDGKMRETDCANTEGIFRIIQSIPSPKAEPFKRWLAKVGYERVQEIENPELAQERMKKLYEQKGYSKDWTQKRLRGIAIRQNLTDEWQDRGIHRKSDYAILTAEISKATFGMTPSEYRKHKNIPEESKANLRDNMTDLELIFTMLGEKVTTEISKKEQPKGIPANKKVANRGGGVAGNARKETEKELGESVISSENYLPEKNSKKYLP
ncbi:Bro-N domain-containing protein [Candidatus Peregrinibacteria bacterium]|nr:Bro-N domain-containing protein [Candidatus Peregrinibacteria bacterium]